MTLSWVPRCVVAAASALNIPVACPFMGVFKSADKSANYSALHLELFTLPSYLLLFFYNIFFEKLLGEKREKKKKKNVFFFYKKKGSFCFFFFPPFCPPIF